MKMLKCEKTTGLTGGQVINIFHVHQYRAYFSSHVASIYTIQQIVFIIVKTPKITTTTLVNIHQ